MARLEEDICLPEDSVIPVGRHMHKVWRVGNRSDVPWPHGSRLVFAAGVDRVCNAPDSIPVPSVAPGERFDLVLEVRARFGSVFAGFHHFAPQRGKAIYRRVAARGRPESPVRRTLPDSRPGRADGRRRGGRRR